jgi:hypothetical protein
MRDGVSRGYESMMKFVVHKPIKTKWAFEKETENKEVQRPPLPGEKEDLQ